MLQRLIFQMYKNFRISSNISTPFQLNYHLIESFDPLSRPASLSPIIYKEKCLKLIEEIIQKDKIPVVEGGSLFYLRYLLFDSGFDLPDQDWKRVYEEGSKLISKADGNWEKAESILKDSCPSYDFSIEKNNFRRLEKAMGFSIITNGLRFYKSNLDELKITPQLEDKVVLS